VDKGDNSVPQEKKGKIIIANQYSCINKGLLQRSTRDLIDLEEWILISFIFEGATLKPNRITTPSTRNVLRETDLS
jgi:hypothetical protein